MNTQRQPLPINITMLLGYGIKYIAYNSLTFAVLTTTVALIMIYLTIVGPEMPFLKYLAPILPIDANGDAELGPNDIMRVFFVGAFILQVPSMIVRIVRGALLPQAEEASSQENATGDVFQEAFRGAVRRLKIVLGLISVIYLGLFVTIPYMSLAEGSSIVMMFVVCMFFYIVAVISGTIFTLIDSVADFMLDIAGPHLVIPIKAL